MKLMSMLAAATAVVLGQDAGVVSRVATDGGVPLATTAQPQPGVVDRSAEIAALREELRVTQAKAQETNAKLDAAMSELSQLKAQLTDQQRVQEQQRSQNLQREDQKQAAVQLSAVDQRLATGDTTVSALMSTLKGKLGPAAQLNLDYASTALQNNDIASARMYLAQAMLEAQAGH